MYTILFTGSRDYEDDGTLENLDGVAITSRHPEFTVLTDGACSLGKAAIRFAEAENKDLIVMRDHWQGIDKQANRLVGAADAIYLGTRTGEDLWARKIIGLAKSVKKNVFISYEAGRSEAITYDAECNQARFA